MINDNALVAGACTRPLAPRVAEYGHSSLALHWGAKCALMALTVVVFLAGFSPADAQAAPTVSAGDLPSDLSPWGMFVHADIVVKAVMVGLTLASIATWTIAFVKFVEVGLATAAVVRQWEQLRRISTLADFATKKSAMGPVIEMVRIASEELENTPDSKVNPDGVKERVAWLVDRVVVQAGRRMARGTGLLATTGAIAPFVGLFGTVWGIMNSFIGISLKHTTNLAVVAPGIAEALLTTALGLAVAIPAVVIYNAYSRSLAGYRASLADSAAAIMRLLSLELDRHAARRLVRSDISLPQEGGS